MCEMMSSIAIEHGPFIVVLPIKNGDCPVRKLLVYQRVTQTLRSRGMPLSTRRAFVQIWIGDMK